MVWPRRTPSSNPSLAQRPYKICQTLGPDQCVDPPATPSVSLQDVRVYSCCRSARHLGEGLLLSFSSAPFDTNVLSNACFGLEFMGNDSSGLHQFNLAHHSWCHHLLGWPRASPIPALNWEVDVGGAPPRPRTRVLPLQLSLCHGPHFISSSHPCHRHPALLHGVTCQRGALPRCGHASGNHLAGALPGDHVSLVVPHDECT